jgi:hypothetical protein
VKCRLGSYEPKSFGSTGEVRVPISDVESSSALATRELSSSCSYPPSSANHRRSNAPVALQIAHRRPSNFTPPLFPLALQPSSVNPRLSNVPVAHRTSFRRSLLRRSSPLTPSPFTATLHSTALHSHPAALHPLLPHHSLLRWSIENLEGWGSLKTHPSQDVSTVEEMNIKMQEPAQ